MIMIMIMIMIMTMTMTMIIIIIISVDLGYNFRTFRRSNDLMYSSYLNEPVCV